MLVIGLILPEGKESRDFLCLDERTARRGGRRVTTDGPFTESKEIVGGFFLVDCATRDEAIALARECPAADWATIEVHELDPCYE